MCLIEERERERERDGIREGERKREGERGGYKRCVTNVMVNAKRGEINKPVMRGSAWESE